MKVLWEVNVLARFFTVRLLLNLPGARFHAVPKISTQACITTTDSHTNLRSCWMLVRHKERLLHRKQPSCVVFIAFSRSPLHSQQWFVLPKQRSRNAWWTLPNLYLSTKFQDFEDQTRPKNIHAISTNGRRNIYDEVVHLLYTSTVWYTHCLDIRSWVYNGCPTPDLFRTYTAGHPKDVCLRMDPIPNELKTTTFTKSKSDKRFRHLITSKVFQVVLAVRLSPCSHGRTSTIHIHCTICSLPEYTFMGVRWMSNSEFTKDIHCWTSEGCLLKDGPHTCWT